MTQIFLIVLSLGLSVLGITGDTRDKEKAFPKNIKPLGWLVATLLFAIALTNIKVVHEAGEKRDRILFSAYREIESAMYNSILPYENYTDPIYSEENPRWKILKSYSEANVFGVLCNLDYRENFSSRTSRSEIPVAKVFSASAIKTREALQSASAKFVSFIDENLVSLLTEIATHQWLDFQWALDARFENRSARDSEKTGNQFEPDKTLTCGKGKNRERYLEWAKDYGQKLSTLERRIKAEFDRLRSKGIGTDESLLILTRSWWFTPQ